MPFFGFFNKNLIIILPKFYKRNIIMKIAVIQGPNLNMLGVREQHIYGGVTLEQIHAQLQNAADQNGVEIEFFQSNFDWCLVVCSWAIPE